MTPLMRTALFCLTLAGLLLVALSQVGCATGGLAQVDKSMTQIADGVHAATLAGHATLHGLAQTAADECRANGVKTNQSCPGWLKIDNARSALEGAAQAVEDALVALHRGIDSYRAALRAADALGGQ